jgi:anti-sigma factor (TIGR02949 family)
MIIDAIRKWMGRDRGGAGNGAAPGGGEGGDSGMISCEEALSRVYEFLDGELDDVSHEEVEAHFHVCTRCYPHLQLENAFREALQRAAAGEEAPPELKSRILALMESEADPD